MAKENKFMIAMKEKGLVDDREIAVVSDIVCTNGNAGRAFVLISGDTMHIYEMAGFADLGAHVEDIDLKRVTVLKASSFVLRTLLKLTYNGNTYTFTGFGIAKKFIGAVQESCGA